MNSPVRSAQLTGGDSSTYPVFIVLADGGASRSGYWTASVLGHLDAATAGGKFPFRQHLFCLSGASGGSVGNGSYFCALAEQLHSDTIRQSTMHFLGHDFLSFTLARMLGPDLIAPVFDWFAKDRAWALEHSLEESGDEVMDRAVRTRFSNYLPFTKDAQPTVRNSLPIIFINTTRMQDGQPGVVSNIDIDSIAKGNRIDVLDSLEPDKDIHLSTCMVMGARFPYVSPAGRIKDQYFVDGGYFDNSGAGIVHEMLQEIELLRQDSTFVDRAALRKLRFYVLHITNTPFSASPTESVHPFKNDLLAPLVTLAGSYSTQTDVNDYRLNNYIDKYNKDTSHITVNLYQKTKDTSFPLTWVISDRMLRSMEWRIHQPSLDKIIERLNAGDANVFKGLGERSYPQAGF
jgi:predicted acylesterase/phospholipase RssA